MDAGTADDLDLGVDRHAVGPRLLDQRLGALGIVGPDLEVGVVADRRRHDHLRRRLDVRREQRAAERLAVDREVHRLADAPIVRRRDRGVDPECRRLRVRIAEVGLGVSRLVHRQVRHHVGLAGLDHRRCDRRVAAEQVGRLLDLRRLAPIVRVALQDDVLAGIPDVEEVGAGADRLLHELVGRSFGGHDRHGGEQERQDRRARRRGDLDGQVVDGLGRELDVAEVLDADFAAELRHLDAVEGKGDVGRVEGGAVVEGDSLAKLDLPGVLVDRRPFGGEPRLQLGLPRNELGQRLVDVLQDDPPDVGACGHAGLNHVKLLVQDDANV